MNHLICKEFGIAPDSFLFASVVGKFQTQKVDTKNIS